MPYVVEIKAETEAEITDYKVFDKRKDAERRHYGALAALESGKLVGAKRNAAIHSSALFEINFQTHPQQAKQLVEIGQARLITSSDNPLPEIDVTDIVAKLLPGDSSAD